MCNSPGGWVRQRIRVTLLSTQPEIEDNVRRLEREQQQQRAEYLSAAQVQLAGVKAVVIEASVEENILACSGVYVRDGNHRRYPTFANGRGHNLVSNTNGEWCIVRELDETAAEVGMASPSAIAWTWSADASDGRLPENGSVWKVLTPFGVEDADAQVTLLHDAGDIALHSSRLLAEERQMRRASLAAARAQLEGVLAVVVEGIPDSFPLPSQYNGVYVREVDHEGWPHFTATSLVGNNEYHLYYAHAEQIGCAGWALLDRLAVHERPDCVFRAVGGQLTEGRVTGFYWSGLERFNAAQLHVTFLRTEQTLREHGQ